MGVVISPEAILKRQREIRRRILPHDRKSVREFLTLEATVAAEIALARSRGEFATPYRKMLPFEWIGAAFCGVTVSRKYPTGDVRHTPGRRAAYVSYGVDGIGGRTVLCEAHHHGRVRHRAAKVKQASERPMLRIV